MLPGMRERCTHDLPGCGGVCGGGERSAEEILAKRPAGTGDHWWLKVSKSGLGTQQARAAIARAAVCDVDLVSCAGNRDRHGQSVQWFSVPAENVEHPGPLRRAGAHGKMRVLELTSSHKPVTAETVAGLRWKCRIRGGNKAGGYQLGKTVLDRLRVNGCPNWVAADHADDDLARLGRLLLEGRPLPSRAAARHVDPSRCRRALQGWLFNRWLAARLHDGLIAQCIPGDRIRSRSGDETLVADTIATQRRLDSWEAVVLGPLIGNGLTFAEGEAAARELAVLTEAGITASSCVSLVGARRAARVQPGKVLLDIAGEDLVLDCEMPVEAAIEVLLDEVMKAAP